MTSPHPKMNKKGIYTKHTSKWLSWLCTYIKSSREKDARHLQELRLWAVLKLECIGMLQASHCSLADPKYGNMQFYGKVAMLYFLEKMWNYQSNHFRFPSTALLLARWGGPGVEAPCSVYNARLQQPQVGCVQPKSPICLLQIFHSR